jgi:hypothetical protein
VVPKRDPHDDYPPVSGRLTRRQRGFIFVGALGFGVLGILATFKTENEAGTAVSLLMCGVLLLVAVQGTKVQRISAGDHSLELAASRGVVAAQAVAESKEDPDAALERLEHYEALDPLAQVDPRISSAKSSIYERQVWNAVILARYEIGGTEAGGLDDAGKLHVIRGRRILVETRYRLPYRNIYPTDARRIREMASRSTADGALVVSNVSPTQQAEVLLDQTTPPVTLVQWDPDAGPEHVGRALEDLLAKIPS